MGTATSLLFAPRSGRETRQLLKKSATALPELAEDLSTSVQLQAGRLSESALRRWDETLVRLREAIAAGIEASQQEQNQEPITTIEPTPGKPLNELYPYKPVPPKVPERQLRRVYEDRNDPRPAHDRDRTT
jgi:gas vesicle protein